jgi:membrane protease YdiL (CAAX protease family)
MSLASYFWIVLMLTPVFAIFMMVKSLNKFLPIFDFLLVITCSYGITEIVYRSFTLALPGGLVGILDSRTVGHLNYFFLHRIYHLLPLASVFALFQLFPRGYFPEFLRIGKFSEQTGIIDKTGFTRSWKEVLMWFAGWTALVFAVLVVYALWKNEFRFSFPLGMIVALLLYAIWNCFVEETLFRGVLLSVFSKTLSPNIANILQAFLFGIVHVDPADAVTSIIKVLLFTFLGWFFGRAARETNGIGASFIMHTMLVVCIELRLLF